MKGKKTGGRKAGTPNKVTGELRERLKEILSAEIDRLPVLLDSLEPAKRAEIVTRLLPLVVSKPLSLEDIETGEITVTMNLGLPGPKPEPEE
jgi:hypothetical protein